MFAFCHLICDLILGHISGKKKSKFSSLFENSNCTPFLSDPRSSGISREQSLPAWELFGVRGAAAAAAAAAKSLQSCPTPCDPRDSSPPGSPVPGILQARTLEWVAISFSNAWEWKVKVKSLLLVTPCTAAYQDPPSMGFSRQEYCSGVPLPSSRQLDSHVQKNEDGSLPHTIYKNEVKLNNKI